jgi:hypothetical protein
MADVAIEIPRVSIATPNAFPETVLTKAEAIG